MFSGNKIYQQRKKTGISRKTLSEKTGIPISTIKSWENSERGLNDIIKAQEIAIALNCSISSLWEGNPLAVKKHTKVIDITFTDEELELINRKRG